MKPTKGLSQDTRPESQPEGTYPFGKNGLQFDLEGSVTNEPGFKQLTKNIVPAGYTINGILETDTTKVLVFFTNDINSGLKLYDLASNTVSFSVIDTALTYKLGFKAENYITGQVQRNNLGELICAFTDKVTFPKFINLDKPTITYLKDWNLFPECVYPTIVEQVQSGGILSTGSYYYATRYYKQDGTLTSFSSVSQGVVVTTTDGTAVADKQIKFTLSNMDLAYDFLEMAIIAKVAGITSTYLLTKVPVVPNTSVVNFTGDGLYETITLEEVLVSNISYDRVGTMGQLNDALYIGNLENTRTVTDMQPYANIIKLEWVSELIDVINAPDEHKSGLKKSFKHGETYAFYIRYKLSDGSFSTAYTIPGVELASSDLALSTVAQSGGLTAFVYEAEDRVTITGTYTGVTGLYQNQTETYPNVDDFNSTALGGEDLRNKFVRHHKMPSIKYCKEFLYSSNADYGVRKLDLLGIKPSNIIIPQKYTDVIVGYEILYAKRTIDNMTVYGQSILIHTCNETYASSGGVVPATISELSVGHNYNVHSASTYLTINKLYGRFHGFDYLFNKPTIKPSFLAAQVKLTTNLEGSYSAFATPSGGSAYRGNSVHLVNNTAGTADLPVGSNIRGISESKRLEHNINNAEYSNNYLESSLGLKLTGPPLPYNTFSYDPMVYGTQGNFSTTGGTSVQSYLVDLCDTKPNIYSNFYAQELVSAGNSRPLNSTDPFWAGDIFLSLYTFHTYGYADPHWKDYYDAGGKTAYPEFRGRRIVNRLVCETVANLYTRYEIAGNIYSKWWDHTTLSLSNVLDYTNSYPSEYSGFDDPNQFGYSKGAEGINDFISSEIYNPYREYQTKFPYRIHRLGKLSRYNRRSWKTALALDYYEVQKNMGFIQHLEGMDDRLLIHCENALFLTQDKGKLEGGMLTVTLGSGDIFQFEPQEAQSSKLGYAGTQHNLSCIRTPIGYVFADSKQGELYMYKSKELNLLNTGMHRFLRDYLKIFGKNPFTGNGITLGWDQRYKRILATVKNIRPADGTNVVIINNPADILEVVGIVGPPLYPDCLITTNGIVKIGDVIFYQGKYMTYLGQSSNTAYSCPADPCDCIDPINLKVVLMNDQISSHVTWGGVGTFSWNLYEVGTPTNTLVQSGTSTGYFVDFTILSPDTAYKFDIWSECGPECVSGIRSIQWTTSHEVHSTTGRSYCLWYTVNSGLSNITVTLMDQFLNPVMATSNIVVTVYKLNSAGVLIGSPLTATITTGNYSVNISVVLGAGEYLAAKTGYAGTITDPSYCGFAVYVVPEPKVSYKFHLSSNLNRFTNPGSIGWSDSGTVEVLSNGVTYTGSYHLDSTFSSFTAVVDLPAPSGPVIVSINHNLMVGPTSVTESGTGSITLNPNNPISLTYS